MSPLVSDSFTYPMRGRWPLRFVYGTLTILVLPLAFIPLLGYSVLAVREIAANPSGQPPALRATGRLISDGFWVTLAIALVTLPFALVSFPLEAAIRSLPAWGHMDPAGAAGYSWVIALTITAFPWGVALLVLLPTATARFALSGSPEDLFDLRQTVHDIRDGFAAWNLAVGAIVTGWAIGLAMSAVFLVGLLPGVFYAILVSSHACATLAARVPAR